MGPSNVALFPWTTTRAASTAATGELRHLDCSCERNIPREAVLILV